MESIDYSTEIAQLLKVTTGDTFTYSVDTLNLITGQFDRVCTREVQATEKIEDGESGYYSCAENYILSNSSVEFIASYN